MQKAGITPEPDYFLSDLIKKPSFSSFSSDHIEERGTEHPVFVP
jgi:hypothetical protein